MLLPYSRDTERGLLHTAPVMWGRGQSEVKQRSHRGHTEVRTRSHRSQSKVKQRSDRGQTEVRNRSNIGQTEVRQGSNKGQTEGMRLTTRGQVTDRPLSHGILHNVLYIQYKSKKTWLSLIVLGNQKCPAGLILLLYFSLRPVVRAECWLKPSGKLHPKCQGLLRTMYL